MRFFLTAVFATLLSATTLWAAPPSKKLVRLQLGGAQIEGTPLAASGNQVVLLDRDGRLWDFDADSATNFKKTPSIFQAYTAATMRSRLAAEFGNQFEVSGTGHYLVVHPNGQRSQWSQRFEDLYRSFVHYFSVRGLTVRAPEFPLVAIVCPTRQDFRRYIDRDGVKLAEDVLGYYSSQTNRVALYDVTDGKGTSRDWSQNADTIIHEATHQTAFNTGVHNRFAPPPRWVAEGLGTLFEAPGVWNARNNSNEKDRINPGRLEAFREYLGRRKAGVTPELISSDRMFDTDASGAYAEAWAFTYFLVETRPREYSKYLSRTAARPDFQLYTQAQRLADFTAVFGQNFRLLDAHFLRFMAAVK